MHYDCYWFPHVLLKLLTLEWRWRTIFSPLQFPVKLNGYWYNNISANIVLRHNSDVIIPNITSFFYDMILLIPIQFWISQNYRRWSHRYLCRHQLPTSDVWPATWSCMWSVQSTLKPCAGKSCYVTFDWVRSSFSKWKTNQKN